MASVGSRPGVAAAATGLGASWIRVNTAVDGTAGDVAKYEGLLDAGLNLIITMSNRQRGNIDTTNGDLTSFPHAGFPFLDEATWKTSVTTLVTPLVPYLAQGRQIMIQVENEVGDTATGSAGNIYWRGSTDQYLDLDHALYAAVKGVDQRFQVVLTSLTTKAVSALTDPANPTHAYQTSRLATLLSRGDFDGIDLHLYGCVSQIDDAAKWAQSVLAPGQFWISTENAGPTTFCPAVFSDWRQDLNRFLQVEANQVPARLQACADDGAKVCLWFSLYDLDDEVDTFNHLGLLDRQTGAMTPAADAFKKLTSTRSLR